MYAEMLNVIIELVMFREYIHSRRGHTINHHISMTCMMDVGWMLLVIHIVEVDVCMSVPLNSR